MATTKKTAPAKKVPAKPRADYKAGTRVKVTLRNGTEDTGRVTGIKTTPTGPFIQCNLKATGDYEARPAKVKAY